MSPVIIRLAGDDEFESISVFVRNKYAEKFSTVPTMIPGVYVIAEQDGKIIGVIELEFSEGGIFSLENIFKLNFSIFPAPRQDFISFGRWVSDHQGVGGLLALGAIRTAISRGKTHALCCAKPNLVEFLRRHYKLINSTFHVEINFEKVPPEDSEFYEGIPNPCAYIGQLKSWMESFEKARLPHVEWQL